MHLQYFDVFPKAQKVYSRLMEPLCQQWNLTRNELDVLLFLANNPDLNRAVDIVNCRGISKSHVSLAVSLMEKKGYLFCQADNADRRIIRLLLTDIAQPIVSQGQTLQCAFYQKIHAGISQEELALWSQINSKIQENIHSLYQE